MTDTFGGCGVETADLPSGPVQKEHLPTVPGLVGRQESSHRDDP